MELEWPAIQNWPLSLFLNKHRVCCARRSTWSITSGFKVMVAVLGK